jgi:hypothetical protein
MVAIASALRFALPPEAPRPALPYGRLVFSALRLLVTHPGLRRRALDGATAFGAFSVLWTCLAFQLSAAPYHYSNAVIGLFGLAGLAGVFAANVAGRLADARLSASAAIASAVAVTASFGLLAFGTTSLVLLITGIVVLDMGVQAVQVTNQRSGLAQRRPHPRVRALARHLPARSRAGQRAHRQRLPGSPPWRFRRSWYSMIASGLSRALRSPRGSPR